MNNSNKNKKLNTSELNWNLIQNDLHNKLGKDIYESWLKKITFVEELNNYLILSVPTRFIRDWITSRYLDQILQLIKNYKKDLIRIEFKIDEKTNNKEINIKEYNKIESIENISFIKDSHSQVYQQFYTLFLYYG